WRSLPFRWQGVAGVAPVAASALERGGIEAELLQPALDLHPLLRRSARYRRHVSLVTAEQLLQPGLAIVSGRLGLAGGGSDRLGQVDQVDRPLTAERER